MENLCNYFPVISAKFLRTSLILLRRSMERFPDWTRKKGIFDSIRCRNVIKCSDDRCFVLRLPFQVCSRAHWHVHVIQLHKFWNIYFHNLGYRGKICYRALYGRTSTQFTVCYIQCVLRGQQQLAETIVVRYWRQIHSCSATCASVDLVRTVSYLPCCSRDPASFSKKKKKKRTKFKSCGVVSFLNQANLKSRKKKKKFRALNCFTHYQHCGKGRWTCKLLLTKIVTAWNFLLETKAHHTIFPPNYWNRTALHWDIFSNTHESWCVVSKRRWKNDANERWRKIGMNVSSAARQK